MNTQGNCTRNWRKALGAHSQDDASQRLAKLVWSCLVSQCCLNAPCFQDVAGKFKIFQHQRLNGTECIVGLQHVLFHFFQHLSRPVGLVDCCVNCMVNLANHSDNAGTFIRWARGELAVPEYWILDDWLFSTGLRDFLIATRAFQASIHCWQVLSPAGGWPQLRAAVRAGADAVYFGLDVGLNARARAANFSTQELPEVMKFLHSHGVTRLKPCRWRPKCCPCCWIYWRLLNRMVYLIYSCNLKCDMLQHLFFRYTIRHTLVLACTPPAPFEFKTVQYCPTLFPTIPTHSVCVAQRSRPMWLWTRWFLTTSSLTAQVTWCELEVVQLSKLYDWSLKPRWMPWSCKTSAWL